MERITLTTKPQKDFELLDSGAEEKLERYGDFVLSRPDPQALWPKRLRADEWQKAAGRYERKGREGEWHATDLPKEWQIEFGGLQFLIKPTSFKHTGLFPEQLSNWGWLESLVKAHQSAPKVLNLFGYTGGASLAAAKAGAEVTHVDASKTAVSWARENAKLSGLEDKPIRWIVEDVLVYLKREIKRGSKYDLILLDPPAFGHGPGGELWKIEEDFLPLMELLPQLLSDKPLGVLINGYAAGYSPLAFAYNLDPLVKKFGGAIEYGDLAIAESNSDRVLPCGIFARWKAQ
ncbi:MAG TPA: class I SAM-dependent methyltransferase [Candidatus Paceibacterota bacterium]|jgi:23S rRNA (cytosine1962-C5)-methyltransferase|nr:class I SAM-dependent methyltransferase [Candidatus Paceibacterota bacterium]